MSAVPECISCGDYVHGRKCLCPKCHEEERAERLDLLKKANYLAERLKETRQENERLRKIVNQAVENVWPEIVMDVEAAEGKDTK